MGSPVFCARGYDSRHVRPMNLRPLLGNFADPQYRLSRKDQTRLTWAAHHQHLLPRTLWLTVLGMVIACILIFGFAHPLLTSLLSSWGVRGDAFPGMPWAWLVSATIYVGIVWIASAWGFRFIYIRPLRQAMRDDGYDLCLGCGYELKGLPDDRTVCPECGTSREAMPQARQ